MYLNYFQFHQWNHVAWYANWNLCVRRTVYVCYVRPSFYWYRDDIHLSSCLSRPSINVHLSCMYSIAVDMKSKCSSMRWVHTIFWIFFWKFSFFDKFFNHLISSIWRLDLIIVYDSLVPSSSLLERYISLFLSQVLNHWKLFQWILWKFKRTCLCNYPHFTDDVVTHRDLCASSGFQSRFVLFDLLAKYTSQPI